MWLKIYKKGNRFAVQKNTMAFIRIASNKCGVQCFCIDVQKNTMAFIRIAFNNCGEGGGEL